MENKSKFRVIVLRCPYDNFYNPMVRDLFPKIAQLKIKGYQKEYPYGVLPFDASDFIATHILLCEDLKTGLKPIMGFKSVTLERCDLHKINFPIFGMLKSNDKTDIHEESVLKLVQTYRERGIAHRLAYNGSFTIDPDFRASEKVKKEIWGIATTLVVKYYEEYFIDHVIAVCATTFKVDRYKRYLGWINLNDAFGNELPSYKCYALSEAPLKVMHVTEVSEAAKSDALKYIDLWNKRITIEENMGKVLENAA